MCGALRACGTASDDTQQYELKHFKIAREFFHQRAEIVVQRDSSDRNAEARSRGDELFNLKGANASSDQ